MGSWERPQPLVISFRILRLCYMMLDCDMNPQSTRDVVSRSKNAAQGSACLSVSGVTQAVTDPNVIHSVLHTLYYTLCITHTLYYTSHMPCNICIYRPRQKTHCTVVRKIMWTVMHTDEH